MSAVSTQTRALPPSYSDPNNADGDVSNLLPAYSPATRRQPPAARSPAAPAQLKEFSYDMKRKGKVFAEMAIFAEGTFSKHMATYLEGQPVKGRVKLCLDKPDAIQSVVVHVQGQVITGANQGEQMTFIDIAQTLWSQALGDPRNTSSNFQAKGTSSSSSPSRRPDTGGGSPTSPVSPPVDTSTSAAASAAVGLPLKFTGKLPEGEYTWEFSIDIPKEVVIPYGAHNEPQVFNPPQTFAERHTRASISYEVAVKFNRNKLLKSDNKISTPFGYIPIMRPPPFSPLRKLAYQEGTALLGPTIDLEGWHALKPIRFQGTLFNNRAVDVGCSFFLAKPLVYTRGTIIPLSMQLQSDDSQALDLLTSTKAIVVRLRRTIKYHYKGEKTLESLSWRDAVDHSQLAVWWPSQEGSEHGQSRYVNGELHLRPDMKPTSAMAHFRIEYSVVLFPFDATGFEAAVSEQLLEVPVDVVTAHAPGPRPTMSAPPGYDADSAVMQPPVFTMDSSLGWM